MVRVLTGIMGWIFLQAKTGRVQMVRARNWLRLGRADIFCGLEWLGAVEPAWVEPKITPLAQTPRTAASSRFPEPHVCWRDVRLGSSATLTAPPAPPCWYPVPLAAAGSTEVLPHKTGSNTIAWHGRTLYCSLL
jgi:hypothetical protein